MKRLGCLFSFFWFALSVAAQPVLTPDKIWGRLFEEVQLKQIFPDNKTFVDAVPKTSPETILKKYYRLKAKDTTAGSLKALVMQNFILPQPADVPIQQGLSIKQHIEALWSSLVRKADVQQKYSSLLPLPKPYIVPGGRFREIYYWDSYFTMLGLAASNRYDLVENMLDNFAWLIHKYGHIPNGNRTYYLSRSQPPFFSLMVDLLQQKRGDAVFKKYFAAMQKEYRWWMQGAKELKPGQVSGRTVKLMDGAVLNRYWDDKVAPREESYAEDISTAKKYQRKDGMAFRHLRAGAESGWDFSSRWFADTVHLATIETANIVPVDLNCLLYVSETILSKAAAAIGAAGKAALYKKESTKRRDAILNYCWNDKEQFFFDYHWKQKHTTDKWSLAGIMPLFVSLATKEQAAGVKRAIEEKFLKAGGVVTTLYNTGQQWDAPNGWAPLQYLSVQGLRNYDFKDLAKTIAERWMAVNESVFAATGKMMEKYNVENIHAKSGGGEYPTQNGFGWTNGVYLTFYQWYK